MRPCMVGRSGMTLVELMVVLAILAAVLTTVSVSTIASRDRQRVEKTQRQGRAMVEALTRTDGLSFISDFGRLPQTIDEVKWLCQRAIFNSTSTIHEAPLYQLLPIWRANTASSTGAVSLKTFIGSSNSVKTALEAAHLGAGWRGPYTSAVVLQTETEEDKTESRLCDAFGGDWVFEEGSGTTDAQLISYGRDQLKDDAGQERSWQDSDQRFAIHQAQISQQVELAVSLTWGEEQLASASIYYFEPTLIGKNTSYSMDIQCLYHTTQTNPASFVISPAQPVTLNGNIPNPSDSSGLTIGLRAIVVTATDTNSNKAISAVQYVHLKPGTNHLDISLYPLK